MANKPLTREEFSAHLKEFLGRRDKADTETQQAEVSTLRAEVEGLKATVKLYADVAAAWGTKYCELRKRLRKYERVEDFDDGGK